MDKDRTIVEAGHHFELLDPVLTGLFACRGIDDVEVLFEYPKEGSWAYGLVTGQAPSSARQVLGDDGVTIYLPTAPNPMSGFLIVVERSKVIETDITSEEVFTYILSAGSVSPERSTQADR